MAEQKDPALPANQPGTDRDEKENKNKNMTAASTRSWGEGNGGLIVYLIHIWHVQDTFVARAQSGT